MSLIPAPFVDFQSGYRFDLLSAAGSRTVTTRTQYSIAFEPGGTAYFLTHDASLNIERYEPSTAWDVTTSPSGTGITLSTSISGAGVQLGRGIEFNPSGTKVFVGIGGAVATDYIEEHALSSAFGGTATYSTRLAAPGGAGAGTFFGFTFNRDGTKIIAVDDEKFYDVTLSTPYDLSTAGAWSSARLDLSGTYTNLRGFCFGKTDKQIIMCEVISGGGSDRLHEYALSVSANMGTASFVRTQNPGFRITDVTFGDGGKRLFGAATTSVRQFNTLA